MIAVLETDLSLDFV